MKILVLFFLVFHPSGDVIRGQQPLPSDIKLEECKTIAKIVGITLHKKTGMRVITGCKEQETEGPSV